MASLQIFQSFLPIFYIHFNFRDRPKMDFPFSAGKKTAEKAVIFRLKKKKNTLFRPKTKNKTKKIF